jgi:hypothetical protein
LRVIATAAFQQGDIRCIRDRLCTCVMRQLRHAACMIGMRMRTENPFDVAQVDAWIPDVRFDQWSVSRHARVNQDIARASGDKEDA